jgi:hypothetical protein
VDARALDLDGRVVAARARSFVRGSPDPMEDQEGHGTHVAGIIGAITDNGEGGSGVAAARILPVKIADRTGEASTSSLVRGLRYAVARGARVVNVSFGGAGYSPLEQEAVEDAVRAGVLVVAAAGNSGRAGSPPEYPGAYRHVLAVAAVDGRGAVLPASTRGPQVALAAPGQAILSTAPPGFPGPAPGAAVRTGTSMATGVAAGAAARLLAERPGLRPAQVRALLTSTARDVGPRGRDDATGAGVLDLAAALHAPEPEDDGPEPNDDPLLAGRTRPLLPAGPGGMAPAVATAFTAGSVDAGSDPRDGFRVVLGLGDRLVARLTGPAETDLDLALWRPGTPGRRPNAAFARQWLAAVSFGPGSQETLVYTAPLPGVYTLEVQTGRTGAGRYAVEVERGPATR